MDIKAGRHTVVARTDVVVYIEEQYSEGSLSSSLVIPTLYLIAH